MHTGVSRGHVPQPTDPPQPSSIAPQRAPASSHVRGTQMVVVVLEDVVLDVVVLAGLVVVVVAGVITGGGNPQSGGVGWSLDLQVLASALRSWLQADRHFRPALALGHAALQLVIRVRSSFLHAFGQRPA